jgi:hypothetical protein
MEKQQKRHQPLRNNAPEPQKKEQDAKTEQRIQTDGVIYINHKKERK